MAISKSNNKKLTHQNVKDLLKDRTKPALQKPHLKVQNSEVNRTPREESRSPVGQQNSAKKSSVAEEDFGASSATRS